MGEFLDWLLAAGVIVGLFFMVYTTYKQQSLVDTVNEIKEMFEDKAETVSETLVYK